MASGPWLLGDTASLCASVLFMSTCSTYEQQMLLSLLGSLFTCEASALQDRVMGGCMLVLMYACGRHSDGARATNLILDTPSSGPRKGSLS